MIDCHTHLEQRNFNLDRDDVIRRCKLAGLRAIITCCAHPDDINVTKRMTEKYPGFIYASASIHPEYIMDVSNEWKRRILSFLGDSMVVGVGETGLDFKWAESENLKKRQVDLFIEFIDVAKKLRKPLIIHARRAFKEAVDILESQDAKNVVMHFFSSRKQLKRVIDNDWYITINTTICRSKKIRKIARDVPMKRILLETDAPWLDLDGGRNEPTAIRNVSNKIAEVRKLSFDEVWCQCGKNAVEAFKLPISIE